MSLMTVAQWTALDSNGDPISGAKLNFYETGTTTPKTAYTDSALAVAASNPLVADASGRFAVTYLTGEAYKLVLTDASDVTITTFDPVYGTTGPISTTAATLLDDSTVSEMNQTLGVPWSSFADTSSNQTVNATTHRGRLFRVDASGGARTVTLPSAATAGEGFNVSVQKTEGSANAVGINPDGSDTIDGESSISITAQNTVETLTSNGSNRWVRVTSSGGGGSGSGGNPQGYIYDLILSNSTGDSDHNIDISTGTCRDSTNTVDMTLSATLEKEIDAAWAVGDGNGGFPSAITLSADTWYNVFLIQSSGGTTDAGFDTDASATNLLSASGYVYYRLLGSILTDSSSNILAFYNDGSFFTWKDVPQTTQSVSTTAATVTIDVPTGRKVKARMRVACSTNDARVYNPDEDDGAISGTTNPGRTVAGGTQVNEIEVITNTSAQVKAVTNAGGGATVVLDVIGWEEITGPRAAGGGGGGGGSGTVTNVASGTGLTGGPITTTGTLSLDINGLSEATADGAADYIAFYDTSGTAVRKELINDLPFSNFSNVVEDTTPQLGGNLDVNGNSIVSTSNGNISITPDGTGYVVLDSLRYPRSDGTNGQVMTTDGSGNITFTTPSGSGDLLSTNNLNDVASAATAFGNIKQAASDSATGVVELATNAETQTGTDTARAVTPAGLASMAASETLAGLIELATSAEVSTGTDTTRAVTPDTLEANYVKQGTHSLFIPAMAMRPTSSNGCAALTDVETTAGRPDMQVLDFDATADEHAQFQIAFPKSWDEGTITFRVHWTSTAVDTDGVSWGLQGVACSDGDTIDAAYGTAVVVDDANQSTAEDLYVSATSGAVTIAGTPAAGDLCYFRIFRDVSDSNDTATEDARLIGLEIFFTINASDDS